MTETLRKVGPDLWVADEVSARIVGEDFALVIDCTGRGPNEPNRVKIMPSGTTSHAWTAEDLEKVVRLHGRAAGPVLIHCRRGVSRSTCAAAAVLLATGQAGSVKTALDQAAYEGRGAASQSKGGLRKWWKAREAKRQASLF